jgi:hypothetical protein
MDITSKLIATYLVSLKMAMFTSIKKPVLLQLTFSTKVYLATHLQTLVDLEKLTLPTAIGM